MNTLPMPKALLAKDIQQLLGQRHVEDLYVPECKDGPTWAGSHMRLDGWAMKRSWSNPHVYGYEIKVSRGDFLRDDKWPGYLPCCNSFYFVCPSGLIQPSELSDQAGLLWVSKTGNVLLTKKKAPYRHVDIPEPVWRYILMSRTQIVANSKMPNATREERLRIWQEWLSERQSATRLGHQVRGKIAEHVYNVERENKRLKDAHEKYDDIRRMLGTLGYNPDDVHWISGKNVERRLMEKLSTISPELLDAIKRLEGELNRAHTKLNSERESILATLPKEEE